MSVNIGKWHGIEISKKKTKNRQMNGMIQTERLTTRETNLSCKLSSTKSRPAAMQFSPLLKNTALHAYTKPRRLAVAWRTV